MAEPSQPTLVFTTAEKPKNLIVINYECPPDPNHINRILEILINVTRLYVQTDMSKAQYIETILHKSLHNYFLYMARVLNK